MSHPTQFDLLRERRFAPFFWTQFVGAANDNVYKNALVVFVTFGVSTAAQIDADTLVNLVGAVFILPFMLLSATAGQLADKFEKSRLIRSIKLFEIAIMVIGFAGFWLSSITLLFVALALLGVHSALFGPVKYAILPQHLATEELVGGNGLVEMGTFVAILLGTIAGGVVVAIEPHGALLAGGLAIAVAVAGYAVSRGDPADARRRARPSHQLESVRRDAAQPQARAHATAWCGSRCSASRGSGSTARIFLAQFPNFTKDVLRRRRARRHPAARVVLRRHRRRLAAVRAPVGTQGRDRPRAVRLDRPHAVRARSVARHRQSRRDRAHRRRSQASSPTGATGACSPTSC